MSKEIRNIAIIAHVDHGKTTMVDQLLRQSGTFAEHEKVVDTVMDNHAIESYKRAAKAWEGGVFENEIAPVVIKGKKGDTIVKEDEEYKKVIFEKIPTLNPSFKKNGGTITPANSSTLNDGASALILMSAEKAKELNVKPLAKIVC